MMRAATIASLALLAAPPWPSPSSAQTPQTSSAKVQENPAGQYVLVKTVVGKTLGAIDARALPVEQGGYNLLRYCWTASNVLGDWAQSAGLTGQLVVSALETSAWTRDLTRVGYPAAPVNEAIGRYEAALVAAGFTDAARTRAVEELAIELGRVRRTAAGAAKVQLAERCDGQYQSLGFNFTTLPQNGRARFIPYVLHEICRTQQFDADDPIRCDYWLNGKTDGPMSFGGTTVYTVHWTDGSTSNGQFDAGQARRTGTVTLQRPSPPKAK